MNARPSALRLLTSSRKKTFRRCARLHHYLYVKGYRPLRESEALRFGTLVHAALELWWIEQIRDPEVRSRHWRRIWARRLEDAAPDAVVDWAPDPLGCALDAIDLEVATDVYLRARARAVVRAYHERWSAEAPRYTVVAVECEFEIPLINPATTAASRTWSLAGKIDVLAYDEEAHVYVVIEHKTTSEDISTGALYWKRLRADGQLSTYCRGGAAWLESSDELPILKGRTPGIDRAVYDVMRRPDHRALKATPMEERKYTIAKTVKGEFQPSRLYATQRENDETVEEHEERVYAAIAKDVGAYLVRETPTRTVDDLRAAEQDDWWLARVIREAEHEPLLAVRNTDACDDWGGCTFVGVCFDGEDPTTSGNFQQIQNVHQELSTLSEAPAGAAGAPAQEIDDVQL